MKYIDAEKLKEEIERRRKFHDDAVIKFCNNRTIAFTHSAGLKEDEELLSLIDSLQQEKPEVDLEKEIDACWRNWLSPSNQKEVEGILPKTEFAMYARHFYELGLKARKK